jgi:hypothetical protein
MNVGAPNGRHRRVVRPRESDMPIVPLMVRTAQPHGREGALLKYEFQMITDRPIEERK